MVDRNKQSEAGSYVSGGYHMKTFISLLLLLQLATACASGPSKDELDAEVKRLCAIDGGVKVYEIVRLPAGKFDELKRRNFVLPDKLTAKPTDEYYVETDRHYYRQGNPEMSRRQYKIIRSSDHKTLGELVFYGRGGGDIPGPWHGSSFTCPDPTQVHFESAIFVKGGGQ